MVLPSLSGSSLNHWDTVSTQRLSLSPAPVFTIHFRDPIKGVFLVMFVYNIYLQVRNLSDRNAKRPNVFMLVASTLLFVMTTTVSCFFSGGAASRTIVSSIPSWLQP